MKSKLIQASVTAFAAFVAIVISMSQQVRAGSFTTGNLVVGEYGIPGTTLTANGTPLTILEYLPSTLGQTTPIQLISLPTNGPGAFTVAGTSTSEGFIARSLNGSDITFGGYLAILGTTNVSGTSTTNPPFYYRAAGQLDSSGNFTIAASNSPAFSGSNIRSVVSDGNSNYWMSGTANASSTTNGGIWYSAQGAMPIIITNGNFRVAKIFNGNLYYTTASGKTGVWGFNGVPTVKSASTNMIAGGSSPYDFAINPAGNVCYVADQSLGILKFAITNLNGSTWSEAFLFSTNNGITVTNTIGCNSIAVDFSGANPVIYATTAEPTNRLIKIIDTTPINAVTDLVDHATVLATTGYTNNSVYYHGLTFAPVNPSTAAPLVSGIFPLTLTNYAGLPATLSVSATGGTPMTYYWYQEIPGVSTNLVQSGLNGVLSYPASTPNETGFYQVVVSNSYSTVTSTSAVAQLVIIPGNPNSLTISPTNNITANAGQTVRFTTTVAGSPPFTYLWYLATATATNLITTNSNPSANNPTLTVSNVLASLAGGYFVVVTNAFSPPATSSIINLTVTNDPNIQAEPGSTYGLVDGTIQFAVTAFGTSHLSYQWYFVNGSVLTPVGNGNTTASGAAVVSGATNSVLTFSNIQSADLTNVLVVVTNVYGSVTSSVASLLAVDLTATPDDAANNSDSILAFWDFNGSEFTNTFVNPNCVLTPVPYLGVGSASAVGTCYDPGTSPFIATTSSDPNDGADFDEIIPGVDHANNEWWSWGTENYPVNGTNKANGVQFNISTRGAKNIKLTYDSRVSPTASDYERVQYTIDGTNWIDYPSSTSFNGVAGSGQGGWLSFVNDFTGFPGVANNTNFAIRIVTEWQNTATYGISTVSNWVGAANSYSSGAVGNSAAGTVTYDLVGIYGDAITNNNVPPVISTFTNAANLQIFTNEATIDSIPITNLFTISGDTNPTNLNCSAISLNPLTVNPGFNFSVNSNGAVKMIITPNSINANVAAAPILVSVTDTNGDTTKAWFLLTVTTEFPAPTMSLTGVSETNTLINTALSIPFTVSSSTDSVSLFTYSATSGNNTVVPNASIVTVTSSNPTNPVVTISPANNQLGVAVANLTVDDHDSHEDKTTTATFPVLVRPNPSILALDYFNYDNSGPLDTISGGYWQHLSGIFHQMQVNSDPAVGSVTVDTLNNTENLQTPLIGAPYSSGTLYYSFIVNMSVNSMPLINGTYFAAFNDGSGVTANVEDCLVAATNGAAPGAYRLGISDDVGANAINTDTVMFPQDLLPGSNYVVVTALNVASGQSTLWINPTGVSSTNVTAITDDGTSVFSIGDFELRESGGAGGAINVSQVKVGTTFLVGPQIGNVVTNGVLYGAVYTTSILSLSNSAVWSDPNGFPLTLSSVGPLSANGTNVTATSTNIVYGGVVQTPDNFSYIISDGSLTATSSVYLTIILPQIGSKSVKVNGSGNPIFGGAAGPNLLFGVESKTNLLNNPWVEVGNVNTGPTGVWSFTDVHQTNPPVIFYRIYYPDNPSSPPQ